MITRSELSKIGDGGRFLSYLKKNYPGLLDKYFPVIDTAAKNKKLLLKLEDRPSQASRDPEERRLGRALGSYTVKTSSSYDPEFDDLIRKMKPKWFDRPRLQSPQKPEEYKKILLAMQKKPSEKSKDPEERAWGGRLRSYIYEGSRSYDPDFHSLIKTEKPEWLNSSQTGKKIDAMDNTPKLEKQNRILSLKDEPTKKDGRVFYQYYAYIYYKSRQFDPDFVERIYLERPEWTNEYKLYDRACQIIKENIGKSKRSADYSKLPTADSSGRKKRSANNKIGNQQSLLTLRNRPSQKSKDPEERRLAGALNSYTTKAGGSYDMEFDRLIRAVKPEWYKHGVLY
jgi:hypothetical protein